MNIVLAKQNETLIEHSKKCLNIWNQLQLIYQRFMGDSGFWENSYVAVMFHDIGKIIQSFQNMITARLNESKPDFNSNFRHELFSGVFVSGIFGAENILPIMAVFSHHKKLNYELFVREQDRMLKYDIKDIKVFLDAFDKKPKFDLYKFPPDWDEGKKFYDVFYNLLPERNSLTPDDRITYIFYKGILHTCDWFASGSKNLFEDLEIKIEDIQLKLKNRIKSNVNFSNFQRQLSNCSSNCIVISPTGSGKTEAALLWAGEKHGKIFYLLPTKVTANALYLRLKTYFGSEKIGLVHSSAYFDRESEMDRSENFLENNFYKPCTVATIDQILTVGFNVGHWTVKSLNLVGAKIIIDEVHAYDYYTLGLMIATIQTLQTLGARFLIMSATMPKYLVQLFRRVLPEVNLFQNNENLSKARNQFFVINEVVDKIHLQIITAIREHRKVLIVVNTVDDAIRLYEKYSNFNPICYHSRFIQKDRKLKEKQLFDAAKADCGCLAITTQVVEVSLDIDFDILFTENAPPEAIIQRAGRVNRKGYKQDTKVIIFRHQSITEEKVYDKRILNKSNAVFSTFHTKFITEQDFQNIVDTVYKDVTIENEEDYLLGLNKYDQIQKHYNYIFDAKISDGEIFTRAIDYINISIIPDMFYHETVDLSTTEKNNFLVNVPFWVQNRIKTYKYDNFIYGALDYNFERGVKTPKDKDVTVETCII